MGGMKTSASLIKVVLNGTISMGGKHVNYLVVFLAVLLFSITLR